MPCSFPENTGHRSWPKNPKTSKPFARLSRTAKIDPRPTCSFNGDLVARGKWDVYQHVYEDAINATSSQHAPWYIVPADRNWVRDLYVCSVLVEVLSKLKMQYPDPPAGLAKIVIK